jgi:hypothetical protein
MSKLISTTIKEQDIGTYNNLRDYLTRNHISIGSFIIQSYKKLPDYQTLLAGERAV